ncbi:MAG: tyrosine--tRNA ligase [Candidatus Rokubacteria bacterium]|nr:tyrosine--tRNA ligase [Candidatus Rokubacteria bacterium]
MASVIDTLRERGFVAQMTETGLEAAAESRLVWYVGFDPTAPSLHVGHLLPVMAMAHVQRAGQGVILVLGGFTGLIGDPSGRASERTLLREEDVRRNTEAIRAQLGRFLDFEGRNAAVTVDNADWLGPMSALALLRDVGKHFSVKAMTRRERVRTRLEQEEGLSFTEFAYPLLQAQDFAHLFDHFGCAVQIGGEDQWGNIVDGVDFVRRTRGARVHGLTLPLLTTASGEKFGKTAAGAVWLDPGRTSPFALFQYFVNTADADVGRLLRLFTFLGLDEIESLLGEQAARPEQRPAQRHLAAEVVGLVHGLEAARAAARAAALLFGEPPDGLGPQDREMLRGDVPTTELGADDIADVVRVVDLLVRGGLSPSLGRARTLIREGGVSVNGVRVTEPMAAVGSEEFQRGPVLLRVGRKAHHLFVLAAGGGSAVSSSRAPGTGRA